MKADRSENTFLFLLQNDEDESVIDAEIKRGVLRAKKIGQSTYLGFFLEHDLDRIFEVWKAKYGVKGEVWWLPLCHAIVTK